MFIMHLSELVSQRLKDRGRVAVVVVVGAQPVEGGHRALANKRVAELDEKTVIGEAVLRLGQLPIYSGHDAEALHV